jgi:hypothetical protein
MNIEQVNQKLRGLYNSYVDHYFKYIVDIFNDYYGEERVDLQHNFCDEFINNTLLNGFYNPETFEVTFNSIDNGAWVGMSNIYNESEENINRILNSIEFQDLYTNHHYNNNYVYILVHFPQVRVSNESGKSTIIKNLFARISLSLKGEFRRLEFSKTHYTYAHFIHGYLHSHVPRELTYNDFNGCCTGTGPINDTIHNLQYYEEDNDYTDQWMQFCWDLDKYVTVESEAGIPYIRMNNCVSEIRTGEEISLNLDKVSNTLNSAFSHYYYLDTYDLQEFVKYLIRNKVFKFKWSHKKWDYAHSNEDLIILISNHFLKWIKTYSLISSDYCVNVQGRYFEQTISINNKLFCKSHTTPPDITKHQNKDMFVFKGEMQKLHIDNPTNNNIGFIWTLKFGCAQPILIYLLKIINIYYGKDSITETGNLLPVENF